MAMNATSAKFLLTMSGKNFTQARERYKETKAELRRDVVLARKHDVSITEISKAAGISRQAVYAMLEQSAMEGDD